MQIIADTRKIRIYKLPLGKWETNAYLLISPHTRESIIVDAPAGAYTMLNIVNSSMVKYILLTHKHGDHIAGLPPLQKRTNARLGIHPLEISKEFPFAPELLLEDGIKIELGDLEIEVIYTPGHTEGGVSLKVDKYLFAGDTIFPGGPGRTDTPSDFVKIISSITEKIFKLPDDTVILPGHGYSTTVKKAKQEYAEFTSRPHSRDLCGDVLWFM